jgi:hypothetical protein
MEHAWAQSPQPAAFNGMTMTEHGRVRQLWSRLGAWVCLLAWLSGQVQLLPLLLALAAMSDSSHSVCVGLDQGKFTLVLRHEAGRPRLADYKPQCDPGNPAHRHGLVAKCVCALSSSEGRTPDHVACFTSSLAATRALSVETPKMKSGELPWQLHADAAPQTYRKNSAKLPRQEAHAPPTGPSHVQFLQCVSLLI